MRVLLGGELGDAIYAMPTLRALGEVDVLVANKPWYRPDWVGRAQALRSLFLLQPYIKSFSEYKGGPVDCDLTTYRDGGNLYGETIASKIARWARVTIDASQAWIDGVKPSEKTRGKVVISRGARWHGFYFPWKNVVESIGSSAVFIGTKQEHLDFCKTFGHIERLDCLDILEVASMIAGSELFIGNQSSPFALCEGMKKKSILEVCLQACDCIYHRDNCTYVIDGSFSFELNGKEYEFPAFQQERKINRQVTPRGGWVATVNGVTIRANDFRQCEMNIRAEYVKQGIQPPPIADIQAMIEKSTIDRVPELGVVSFNPSLTQKVRNAKNIVYGSPPN